MATGAIMGRGIQSLINQSQSTFMGTFIGVDPLLIELHDTAIQLADDDFVLAQWVEFYNENTGIELDDIAILDKRSGTWILIDVISEKAVSGGNQMHHYEHVQFAPESEWNIEHRFGRNPVIQCFDATGAEIQGEIQHDEDKNRSYVEFSEGMTGVAECSASKSGIGYYVHTQADNESEWHIIHNLGYKPVVQAFDHEGIQIEGEIQQSSNYELYLQFSSGIKGEAYCT